MENVMMNHCSNPNCGKPLHYLREGRIYVFDVEDPQSSVSSDGRYPHHHLEHFWLCGRCSETLSLERAGDAGIRLMPKAAKEHGTSGLGSSDLGPSGVDCSPAQESNVVLAC
jgi:hypothetical protein